jgi:enhancing lycopene biosynthesis protein 2
MSHKVGVLLSGCGYLDGAEIHESVCALLALDEAGAEAICMATDTEFDVVNHITEEPTGERRNVLVEAARIARGKIRDVKDVSADELDALVLPGGYGAAKNLSDFASKGADMTVDSNVESLVRSVHAAGKPIGAICIAPAIISKLLPGVSLTIGNDADTAAALEKMGTSHCDCAVTDFVIDKENKVVSTPAYMLGPWVHDVHQGIRKCVQETLAMVN